MKWRIWQYFIRKCQFCENWVYAGNKAKWGMYTALVLFFIVAVVYMFATIDSIHAFAYTTQVRVTPELKALAEEIVAPCENETNWDSCEEELVTRYALLNVTYQKDSWWEEKLFLANDPVFTLDNEGDCENQALLMISLLKSLHPERPYWFVMQDRHACMMARIEMRSSHDPDHIYNRYYRFFNCYDGDILAVYRV